VKFEGFLEPPALRLMLMILLLRPQRHRSWSDVSRIGARRRDDALSCAATCWTPPEPSAEPLSVPANEEPFHGHLLAVRSIRPLLRGRSRCNRV